MPRIDIEQLPDTARIWIFGISPSLDEPRQQRLLAAVDQFLDGWTAHGQPIHAARDVHEGTFLVIAVDEAAETSGCSIDRMFGTLQEQERELGVALLDSSRVFVRHGDGRPEGISRSQFRQNADGHTVVFDTTADQLGQIRTRTWERPASQSWHQALLQQAV